MRKFRIAIQGFERGKPREFRNITILSDNKIDKIRERIIDVFEKEYDVFSTLMTNKLLLVKKRKELEKFVKSDLFDKKSVGGDISYEEFIENEKFFARHG